MTLPPDPEALQALHRSKRNDVTGRRYCTHCGEDSPCTIVQLLALLPSEPGEALVHHADEMRAALVAARTELARWGWGDMHYGSQGQERSVVDALAAIDAALAKSGPADDGRGLDEPLHAERVVEPVASSLPTSKRDPREGFPVTSKW